MEWNSRDSLEAQDVPCGHHACERIGRVQVKASHAGCSSSRHVARLIVDEDHLICAEVQGFQRERVGARVWFENMRVGGIDEGIDHASERHRQQPVLAMEQLKLVGQDAELKTGLFYIMRASISGRRITLGGNSPCLRQKS